MLSTFKQHWKNFKQSTPAIQTANEKFQRDDTNYSAKEIIYLKHMIPGI